MTKPSFAIRIILTFVVSVVFYWIKMLYLTALPSIEAAVAVNQVQDSVTTYAASQAFIRSDMGTWMAWLCYFVILFFIWGKWIKYQVTEHKKPSNKE